MHGLLPLRLLWICSLGFVAAVASGCGSVAASSRPGTQEDAATVEPSGHDAATVDEADTGRASPPLSDAGAPPSDALPPGTLPHCSVATDGGLTASWAGAQATVSFSGGSLYMQCTRDGDAYFSVELSGVDGPGTYPADEMLFGRLGDAGGYFDNATNAPACSVVVDRVLTGSRGGLYAHLDCEVARGYEDEPPAEASVHVLAVLDMPAVLPGSPPPLFDAGAGPFVPEDAGAGGCMMQVSGAYTAPSTPGNASAGGWGNGTGQTTCTVASGGTSYSVFLSYGEASTSQMGHLTVAGESWCSAGCQVDFDSDACVVEVLRDDGVGGVFQATFTCSFLSTDAGAASAGDVEVTGSVQVENVQQLVAEG